MCGGCNLIDKLDYPRRIANDKNKYLIAMWSELVRDGDKGFPKEISRELYKIGRDSYNKKLKGWDKIDDACIGWYGFMGSYNGRFFDGGYSGHNVKGRDYIGEQIRNTLNQVNLLQGVTFISVDYKQLCLPSNSVIYCDIPYKNTKQYSTSKDFNHEEFWQWCRDKAKEGHKVFISEYNAPYDFECIWEKEVTNSLSTKNTYKPIEKLFTFNL